MVEPENFVWRLLFNLGITAIRESIEDLGRKCSAWKDFGLTIEISLPPFLRDRVKCGWRLGVKDLDLEKPTYQILASF